MFAMVCCHTYILQTAMQLNIQTFPLPLSNEKRCITLHFAIQIFKIFVLYCVLFSSRELKAQVSFFYHDCPSSLSVLALSLTFHIFIFFSRTTGPILTKLGTMPPRVMQIQVCSNDGSTPFPRGDNYEVVKKH